MYELIITEKPNASFRIATAIADGKVVKKSNKGVPYYEITHKGKQIVVGCAVGHLYTVAEKEKNGWTYPVFEMKWTDTASVDKNAKFTKKYLNTLKKLCKDADSYVVATDYDIEGEVIGLNCIRFICKQKDAQRMKFSTLTKPDLISAYENKSETLNWSQANAGETRHFLDWLYGINLSRALTASIKAAGMFKVLSSGRVQGPALKIIVDREKEIKAFKSVPYWQIELLAKHDKGVLDAWHKEDKFWEKENALKVMENVKGQKNGVIAKVERSQFKQNPPIPFDLTTLQTVAYRCFKISPKETLAIAQELYTNGYISYPRTSSQKLPAAIDYKRILNELAKQHVYKELCNKLLATSLKPNEGKKTDPAHPAIYPTGEVPEKLEKKFANIYDLIVRRFMAVFGEPATRETMTVEIDVNKELFIAKGVRTVDKGWYVYYGSYAKKEEIELPAVQRGDEVVVQKMVMHDKETQPPKRYTPASIVRELERRNLGTKATRAQIVDTLFQRGYVHGKVIEATELGIHTVETLEKYCPSILDEELTRHFEVEMEEIQEKKKKGEEVLEEAKDILVKILSEFKKKEKSIGEGLLDANKKATRKATTVGKCPNCGEGELVIRKGKFGRFVACNKYPNCNTTFSLPNSGTVKVSDKICEACQHPMVTMIRKGKKPQEVCINKDCPSKNVEKSKEEGKACPTCKEGKLVLRKSVYGSFLGCSRYPKCRYTEKINNGNQKK
jgi:DNA topoisomerase-1